MNRRGFLTGLASLVVPVPAGVTAPFVVNCAGRVGGVRYAWQPVHEAVIGGKRVALERLPDGSWRALGSIANCVITGTVSV